MPSKFSYLVPMAFCWAHIPTLIAFHTGMRMGEVLALSWEAVDMEHGRIEVRRSYSILKKGEPVFKSPKTRVSRGVVDIGSTLVEALRLHRRRQLEQRLRHGGEWKNENDLVCCYEDGRPIDPLVLGMQFGRYLNRLGWRGSFHGLRHGHASALIQAGVPVNTVSARLGHANVNVTLGVYAHVMPGMSRHAADVFERLFASTETNAVAR